MSNIGSNINNPTKLLSDFAENKTSNENINSLKAFNSINTLEDTLDDVFGINNTNINNTNIQSNIIQNNNQSYNNNQSDNNNLLNNNFNFEIFGNGTPLSEFDNSNKNVNQNIIKSPNRKVTTNNVVNSNIDKTEPINNIINISNNINTIIKNSNNNNNNILKDGLLETSTLDNDLISEEYYYLDNTDNISNNISNNISDNISDNVSDNVSDNFVLEFPARMSDGRQFTDYKSNGFLNLHEQELKNTLEYRLYLQENAENIMSNNYNIIASINDCSDCPGYQIVDTKSLLTCNKESCIQELKDESGLGFDIQYVTA